MAKNSFGKFLKKLRESLKMSQDKFAAELGCTGSYISLLERGKRQPSTDFITKFEERFKQKIPAEIVPVREIKASLDGLTALGRAIRERRVFLGRFQTELGKKAGIGSTTISKVESGKMRISKGTLSKLAKVLELDPDLLPAQEAPLESRKEPDMKSKAFAKAVRAMRIIRGIKQADFAKEVGISVFEISFFERGKRSFGKKRIQKIIETLGFSSADGLVVEVKRFEEKPDSLSMAVKLYRNKEEITTEVFAQKAEVGETAIYWIEKGDESRFPSPKTLKKVENFLASEKKSATKKGRR